jgi:hypothetical protein
MQNISCNTLHEVQKFAVPVIRKKAENTAFLFFFEIGTNFAYLIFAEVVE